MQNISEYTVMAGLVYSLLEFIKPIYDQIHHKWDIDRILALVFGIAVCVLSAFDILGQVGITFIVPYVGQVLTGVLVGGAVGAGLIHDFPDWLTALFAPKTVKKAAARQARSLSTAKS